MKSLKSTIDMLRTALSTAVKKVEITLVFKNRKAMLQTDLNIREHYSINVK